MVAENRHVQDIPAPPEQVWAVLTDLEGWPAWNPTLLDPHGELVEGSVVRMKLQLGRRKTPMKQNIVEVSPPTVLRWQSRFGADWLFVVDRTFRLDRVGEATTRFEQSEVGRGLLARPIFAFTGPPTVRGFVALADALADRMRH